jgi:inosine-uridine nucleoside N-ribohydrolase
VSGIWVDTDFGFDDLWALLVLRHLRCDVAGVSLVAGNAPLPQVVANAMGAKLAYGFNWPIWQGAARPLQRAPETAERILGPAGMRSRGMHLPASNSAAPPQGAIEALQNWLATDTDAQRTILALGPLTNIALLLQQSPEAVHKISRLVWMGGSTGAGNHTPKAEFNAVADAEAVERVLNADVPLDIVDLQFCRGITFTEKDMPETDTLTGDLLGGYLDIALERGRTGMAIYDPLAALAVAAPDTIAFSNCTAEVSTEPTDTYGATRIKKTDTSNTRLAVTANADLAQMCLNALKKEAIHGHRQ